MNVIDTIKRNKGLIFDVIFIVLVVVFSFPSFEPDFNVGLDAPFNWGYNYLWIYDYDTLKEIIYSYGPLGFLKKPIAINGGNTVLIAILFYTFCKLLFLSTLLFLGQKNHKLVSYLLVFLLAYFLNFDSILIGLSVIGALFFIKNNNLLFYGALVITCLIGFYIKYTIGVACLSVVFICCSIIMYKKWDVKYLLKITLITFGLFFATSLIIGGNLLHLLIYIKNGFMISKEYSSSLSLHPENNWWLLSLFILTIITYPFIRKKKPYTYLLLILPLFLMWKQALVREDFSHYILLVDFMVVFWGMILLLDTKITKKLYLLLIPIISVLAIHKNAENVINYEDTYLKNTVGVSKLKPYLFSFNKHTAGFYKLSQEKIKVNRIEPELREIVSNNTIDIYPWDLSYVPANEFNWKPRKTFQSMGISGWNDQQTAVSYTQKNGPDFILFHNLKDSNGVDLGAIDFRYLLNQDPLTNDQILTHYNIVATTEKYTLFQKNKIPNFKKIEMEKVSFIDWNKWVDCPKTKRGILKASVKITKSFGGNMLQLLYKDVAYYIDYQLTSGKIFTYRFIPSNAENGLWVNPFVSSFRKEFPHQQVVKIRLRTTTDFNVKSTFLLKWVFYEKSNSKDTTLFQQRN